MAIYLVELPLTVRLYEDNSAPEAPGSIKFLVDAEDSQEATNTVAAVIVSAYDEALDEPDAPVLLS